MDEILKLEKISKKYKQGGTELWALKDISLSIDKNSIISVMGASGSGKSTLLQIAGLLDVPTLGDIYFMGQKNPEKNKTILRRKNIGFVYQNHYLMNDMKIIDNVAMPLLIQRYSFSQARKMASEILERVGLSEKEKSYPNTLSGGQCQRASIARAIITKPDLILADEPTGNLDHSNAEKIINIFLDMRQEFGTSFIIATHNIDIANKTDKIIKL